MRTVLDDVLLGLSIVTVALAVLMLFDGFVFWALLMGLGGLVSWGYLRERWSHED